MANKSEYLIDFYNFIDEEFFVLNNSSEFNKIPEVKKLYDFWLKKDLDSFRNEVIRLFDGNKIVFIIPDEAEEKQNYCEIAVLRLFSLFSIINDTVEELNTITEDDIYQKLVFKYPNSPIDFTEIAAVIKTTKKYIDEFYSFILELDVPDNLQSFGKKAFSKLQTITNAKTNEDLYENLYDFFNFVNNVLDGMEGQEFDWSNEEVNKANVIFAWLLFVESVTYYLLLVKEQIIDKQEKLTNISFQKNKDILEQRSDAVEELKILDTLTKYKDA